MTQPVIDPAKLARIHEWLEIPPRHNFDVDKDTGEQLDWYEYPGPSDALAMQIVQKLNSESVAVVHWAEGSVSLDGIVAQPSFPTIYDAADDYLTQKQSSLC